MTHANGNGHDAVSDGPDGADGNGAGDDHGDHGDRPPAHVRRARRRPVVGRRDPRSAATRLPIVLVLAAVIVAAVAVEARRGAAGGEDTSGPAAAATPSMPATPGAEAASSTWYCAAGTAQDDGSADHSVTILNDADRDVEATVTIYVGDIVAAAEPAATDPAAEPAEAEPEAEPEAADEAELEGEPTTTVPPAPTAGAAPTVPEPVTEVVTVPAGGQASLRLRDVVQAPLGAALVEVDAGTVAVEHTVRGDHGTDTGPCSTFAATTWHLAWGSTARDTRELVVLFNPFPSAATVDASFVTEEGRREPVRFQGFPVPAGSVVAVDLGDDVTRAEQVAATFEARTGRIVVERLQQYDGSLGPEGQALALGTPVASTEWVFPDGEASAPSPATPAPEERDDPRDDRDTLLTTERIAVYNPGDERAEVEVHALASGEGAVMPQPFRLSLAAGRYEIVDYGGQERIVPGVPHTTVVRSTNGQPVVAERILLDQGPLPERARSDDARPGEFSLSPGSSVAAVRWFLPSVAEIGGREPTVDVVVYNPSPDTPHLVMVAVTPAPGSDAGPAPAPAPVEVAPGGRAVISIDAAGVDASGGAVVTADGPIVAERVVRAADGRRVSARPAIPDASTATPLGAG